MKIYLYFLRVDKYDKPDFEFMREYSYCLRDNYNGSIPVNRDHPDEYRILYAYTNDKDFAKIFERDRDMNLFRKCTLEMDKKSYKNFVETTSGFQLNIQELYDGEKDKYEDLITYPMVITDFEWGRLTNTLFLAGSFMSDEIFPGIDSARFLPTSSIFTKEIRKILEKFGFEQVMNLIDPSGAENGEIDYFDENFNKAWNEFIQNKNVKTMSIFIKLFGNTLKEED